MSLLASSAQQVAVRPSNTPLDVSMLVMTRVMDDEDKIDVSVPRLRSHTPSRSTAVTPFGEMAQQCEEELFKPNGGWGHTC
jgi:hypothetical protein